MVVARGVTAHHDELRRGGEVFSPLPRNRLRSDTRSISMAEMTKETRKRFGLSGKPLDATRVLVKGMNAGDFNGQTSHATIVINDHAGTITPANHYNGNLGANFNAQPRPLPGEDRFKDYAARGYKVGSIADFAALREVDAKTGKPVTKTAPATA
jgi:hypothetical protein